MAGISGTSCRLQNMKLRAVVLCMITVFLSSANGTDIRHRKDTSFSGSLLDPNVTQAISSWIQNVRHGLWMTSFPNAALKTVNDVIFQLGTSYGSYKCFQDVRLSLKRLAVTKNSDVMIDWSLQSKFWRFIQILRQHVGRLKFQTSGKEFPALHFYGPLHGARDYFWYLPFRKGVESHLKGRVEHSPAKSKKPNFILTSY